MMISKKLVFEKDGKTYSAYQGIVRCTKDNKLVWQTYGHLKDGAFWTKEDVLQLEEIIKEKFLLEE